MNILIWIAVLINAISTASSQPPLSFKINGSDIVCKADSMEHCVTMIPESVWEQAVGSTQFSVNNLRLFQKRKLHIEIADKSTGLCNRGIGLGCTMLECNGVGCRKWFVNSNMRLCCVTAQRLRDTVKLVFNSTVNWRSLQMDAE